MILHEFFHYRGTSSVMQPTLGLTLAFTPSFYLDDLVFMMAVFLRQQSKTGTLYLRPLGSQKRTPAAKTVTITTSLVTAKSLRLAQMSQVMVDMVEHIPERETRQNQLFLVLNSVSPLFFLFTPGRILISAYIGAQYK